MKRNPYELLKIAQDLREKFNDMINSNIKYDEVIAVKEKYFNQVEGNYNFEGNVFQIGYDKAQEMLSELKELDA